MNEALEQVALCKKSISHTNQFDDRYLHYCCYHFEYDVVLHHIEMRRFDALNITSFME